MGAIQSWLTKEKAEERRKLLGDALGMIGISGGGLKYLGKSIHNPLRFDVWTLNPLNSKTGYFTPQTLQNQTNHPLGWFCGRFC